MAEDKEIKLGDKIKLNGFSGIDNASMVILKKIIGNYTRKIIDNVKDFEELSVDLSEKNKKFDINVTEKVSGKENNYKSSESNIYVAIDKAFKQIKY